MKNILRVLVCLLCASIPAQAQIVFVHKESRFIHYVKTHKVILVADTLLIMAEAADAASSVHCQTVPGCVEQNGTLGRHPSVAATWGWTMGAAGVLVTANHVWWWATNKYDSKDLRPLMFLWNAPLVITQVFNVKNNVDAAEYLQNRERHIPRVRLPHYRD
jgi:hypothetical protein